MEHVEAPPATDPQDEKAVAVQDDLGDGKLSILIVDDSLTVRMDLKETFESAGFAVRPAETLAAARAALTERAFALVILDILLPDGDGIDLLREIKSGPSAATPVILLSTEAEVRDRVRGLKTGAEDYVGKPYDRSYVLARSRRLMRSGEPPKSLNPRLLLIDDSATFREKFKSLLEEKGYTVDAAARGDEGLNKAFALRPDVIIVDRVLPGELDGGAVIQHLKQDVTLRNTPCLLLTGWGDSSEELRALDAGADAYLSKDTDVNVILARIAALLRPGKRPSPVDTSDSSLLGAKRILAVDDSVTFLNEVSTQLHEEGYGIVQARSGKEALELLEVQSVDCILMDVRMPELSGYEVCRIVKKRPALRNIPLLMLTAADEPEAVIEGINSGADDYVSKSSDFTVLKARVRAQLRRKQFEDENQRIRDELQEKELETAKAHATQQIAEARAALVDELEKKNRELEAFAYAASHDLRAPLRTVRGFSKALLDDFGSVLPAEARKHIDRVQAAASRMGNLIDALLELSRAGRADLNREPVDVSKLVRSLAEELAEAEPDRHLQWRMQEGITAFADAALVRVVFYNLLANAWKFTGKTAEARVEIGASHQGGRYVYFVRDNGVGFDCARAKRLFQPFERLHAAGDFPGAGIGLATVRRIVERHGGEIWAESTPGQGATFFLTLDRGSRPLPSSETPA